MKQIITNINKCGDCPHKEHTGAFTKGGAKPCCNHPAIVKSKGDSCFDRVIPYSNKMHMGIKVKVAKKIPDWCPL